MTIDKGPVAGRTGAAEAAPGPGSLEGRIEALAPGLARLHASPWLGLIEEVGTGSWIQALLQSEPGASASLWAGRTSYASAVQSELYGAAPRSVAAATVAAWARHNLSLLPQLPSVFSSAFSLAISGAVRSPLQQGDDHAWLALALGDGRGWTLHLRCREAERLAQQLSLGELGCRLLIQLADGVLLPGPAAGLEVDVWTCWQANAFDHALDAVDLVAGGASPLVLLQPIDGQPRQVRYLDLLRGRRLLLHKGSFNPVTHAHLSMVEAVLALQPDYLPVLEISLQNADKGEAARLNLAHRLMMLARTSPWPIALTRTPALYQTRELFARAQPASLDFVCGEDLFRRVFLARYYQDLDGGIAAGLQRLFGSGSRLWVCGRESAIEFPEAARLLAESYGGSITQVPLALPLASSAIRAAIAAGSGAWRSQVAPAVAEYIDTEGLYRSASG